MKEWKKCLTHTPPTLTTHHTSACEDNIRTSLVLLL